MGKVRVAANGARAIRLSIGALLVALPLSIYGFGSASPSRAATTSPHIMVIVMENEGYAQIIGNTAQAPYINSLASTYSSATTWYGLQHSSLADYVALISGTTGTYSAPTLVGELASKGISWKAYMEDMPSVCYTGKGVGNYSKLHNPFVYFKSIRTTALCNQVVPFLANDGSGFAKDLQNNTAPDFMWVTPTECHDMNTKCAPLNNHIKQGDQWLSATIPAVLGSPWYASGGTVIITWDSADSSFWNTGSGGRVPTIVISAKSKGSFTMGGNHYGTLRAIEEAYGIAPVLGGSANPANGDLTLAFG